MALVAADGQGNKEKEEEMERIIIITILLLLLPSMSSLPCCALPSRPNVFFNLNSREKKRGEK